MLRHQYFLSSVGKFNSFAPSEGCIQRALAGMSPKHRYALTSFPAPTKHPPTSGASKTRWRPHSDRGVATTAAPEASSVATDSGSGVDKGQEELSFPQLLFEDCSAPDTSHPLACQHIRHLARMNKI